MASSSTRNRFLPGFGFDPSKADIVRLLKRKESGRTEDDGFRFIKDVDLYNHEVQQLYANSIDSGHVKRYFFTKLTKKYKNKKVVDRQTPSGKSWRITGAIDIEGGVAKETSFAHTSSENPKWLMKEYMLLGSELPESSQWALCVVYYK